MIRLRDHNTVLSVALAAASVLVLIQGGCRGSASKIPGMGADSSQTNGKPEAFNVAPEQMAHLQIVTVTPTTISRMLRLTGTVAFNGFATTPVITQVSGPVSRILVAPGQQVRRGQPLLYVSSPDYSQLQANYLKMRDAFQLANKNYVRAQDLFAHHAIAQRDLDDAESARTQASADYQAAQQALKILGISRPEAAFNKPNLAEVPVLAPLAGEIVERLASPGQVIQSDTTQVFTISNTSSVWVLANVYPKELPYVHVGDSVIIAADSYPGQEFRGKISYLAAALDPNTRTLQARIDVTNPKDQLKKDMYVTVNVQAGKIRGALTVPFAAVLHDTENQPFVYAVGQDNTVARRDVTVGETSDGRMQLLSGVTAGEHVVGDGSLFLQFANSLQQ